MLRIIVLLAAVVTVAVLAVPRLLSRSSKPAVGNMAPDFTLPSQDGPVSLKDYRGKWVVLYFYPKDQTPG
jgi:peroxiredoxin Q/BCP